MAPVLGCRVLLRLRRPSIGAADNPHGLGRRPLAPRSRSKPSWVPIRGVQRGDPSLWGGEPLWGLCPQLSRNFWGGRVGPPNAYRRDTSNHPPASTHFEGPDPAAAQRRKPMLGWLAAGDAAVQRRMRARGSGGRRPPRKISGRAHARAATPPGRALVVRGGAGRPYSPIPLVPPPPSPNPCHPLPCPPMRTDRKLSSPFEGPTSAEAQRRKLRVQGLPCPRAVPGSYFIHPLRRPGSYLRRALGCSCVVSRGIRFVAASRGSNPRSRFNPQAATRSRRQNHGSNPSCAASCRDSTAIQPQSCTGRSRAPDRRSQARQAGEKTRKTKRIESNGDPAPHAEWLGSGLR